MTFNYTHGNDDVESSAVYEAYYNSGTKELAVVLSSGHGYVYSGVPFNVYTDVESGTSPGKTYATVVKRNYGPGKSLGYVGFDNEDEFEQGVVAPDMSAVGTPKGLTYAKDATVTDLSDRRISLAVDNTPVGVKFKHTVVFTVDGGNREKSYTVDAGSVNEAAEALKSATDALGLTVKVKEVTVYFE